MEVILLTHLMIAGSRSATPAMLAYARRTVARAHKLGWTILVGDNPQGVDMAVVSECRMLKVPVIVAGIGQFPRNRGCNHAKSIYLKIERDLYRGFDGESLNPYTVRDRWLVDNCQKAMFIWNGDSPGTKLGYDYAVQRKIEAHLVNFDVSGLHSLEKQV